MVAQRRRKWRRLRRSEGGGVGGGGGGGESRFVVKIKMYLWWVLCTLCLLASQVRVIVGNTGLCCGVRV